MKKYLSLLLICLFLYNCEKDGLIVQGLMDLSGAPLEFDDSHASKHLKTASVAMRCSYDKHENIEKIINTCQQIKTECPDIELIVFSESVLGYYFDADDPVGYQRWIAEAIPGAATNRLAQIADSLDIYLVFGMSELKDEKVYNSQVLLNPKGEIQTVHRKVNLVNYDVDSGIMAADDFTVTSIKDIKIGMIICSDVQSYFLTENLVHEKIEILVYSLASNATPFTFDTVARQFNAWVIFSNRIGKEKTEDYSGTCYIADPAGTIRSSIDGTEGYIIYNIGVN